MLRSTVFHLKALERGSLPQYMGAALRAEFLNWMGESDSELADDMHDGNEMRPYTVSDLKGTFRAQKGFNIINSGQSAWFRAATLSKEHTKTLRDSVEEKVKGKVFELGGIRFQVQNVAKAGEHPWAQETSHQSLVDRYIQSDSMPLNTLSVEFSSLTTFHTGEVHTPLPIPEMVLGSWLARWNKFSSASLPRVVNELNEAKLALSKYEDLNTTTARYEKATWVGFTGKCRFRVLSNDEFWIRICSMLAEYSFYCGTGIKTAWGLGQTKHLDELDRKNP